MCTPLRKVTFCISRYEFNPDATPAEVEKMEELCKERNGYFHRWVEEVDTSKDIPHIKTMALVEDNADGLVHMVEYQNLKFVEE